MFSPDWKQRLRKLWSWRSIPGWIGAEESVSGGRLFKWFWNRLGDLQNVQFLWHFLPKMPKGWTMNPSLLLFVFGILWLTAVVLWPSGVRAIIGTADTLVLNLDDHEFRPSPDWSTYTADFGVFIHLRIAVTDKPRTVTKFILQVAIPRKGSEGVDQYVAESEREIGAAYYHQYHKDGMSAGYRVLIPHRDSLVSLLKTLQTPLLPETHAEGWIRFELKNVENEGALDRSGITLYAVDVRDKHYKMDVTKMRVASLKDREYIFRQE
jgi:hypothetical protein